TKPEAPSRGAEEDVHRILRRLGPIDTTGSVARDRARAQVAVRAALGRAPRVTRPPQPLAAVAPTAAPPAAQGPREDAATLAPAHGRVHTDSQKAKDLGAHAYTEGKDVHFAPGKLDPSTDEGKGLIAHELVHVAQQQAPAKTNGTNGHANGHSQGITQPGDAV